MMIIGGYKEFCMSRNALLSLLPLVLVMALISCSGEKSESAPADRPASQSAEQQSETEPDQIPAESTIADPEATPPEDAAGQVSEQSSDETASENPGTVNLDPDAVSFTAYDIDGNLHLSSQWIGRQPVVINFWGTWCPPCRREIPDLVKLYAEYKSKGVEIISFAVRDTPERVRSYAAQQKMEWVLLMANKEAISGYRLTGSVPTTIFIDRTGKELGRFIGARPYDMFRKAFELVSKE